MPESDEHPDTLLDRVAQRYEPLIVPLFQLHPFTVTASELHIGALRADSSKALLRSGRCQGAYAGDSTRDDLILTGDSRDVRSAYTCFMAARNVMDTAVYRRARTP